MTLEKQPLNMDRQQKIDVLQKELSRKDLDTWCLVKTMFTEDRELYIEEHRSEPIAIIKQKCYKFNSKEDDKEDDQEETRIFCIDYMQECWRLEDYEAFEIIWHPVILSDVLVWLDKIWCFWIFKTTNHTLEIIVWKDWELNSEYIKTIILWRDLTKPYLSEQSDEVINGLYEVYLLTKKD